MQATSHDYSTSNDFKRRSITTLHRSYGMRITEFAETGAVLSHSYMLILDFNLSVYIYTATLQHLRCFRQNLQFIIIIFLYINMTNDPPQNNKYVNDEMWTRHMEIRDGTIYNKMLSYRRETALQGV